MPNAVTDLFTYLLLYSKVLALPAELEDLGVQVRGRSQGGSLQAPPCLRGHVAQAQGRCQRLGDGALLRLALASPAPPSSPPYLPPKFFSLPLYGTPALKTAAASWHSFAARPPSTPPAAPGIR
jgi:hypothetical protein